MKRFIVRTNCEYSMVVEAESAEDALEKAKCIPPVDWDQAAWSETEAEEERS